MSGDNRASDTGQEVYCRRCSFCEQRRLIPDPHGMICIQAMIQKLNYWDVTWHYNYGTSPDWCPRKGGDHN